MLSEVGHSEVVIELSESGKRLIGELDVVLGAYNRFDLMKKSTP